LTQDLAKNASIQETVQMKRLKVEECILEFVIWIQVDLL